MRTDGWIDKKTRVITHEFWTYNNNLNYFTVTRFVLEWTAGGKIKKNKKKGGKKINNFILKV
jgi:hypothetical protein